MVGGVQKVEMKISLVVSSYNRPHLLANSIPSWFAFTPPDELILINDGKRDHTEAIFNEWREKQPATNFIYKHREKAQWINPAIPHNWGVKQASNEIIAITDPECIFVTDAIGFLKRDIEEGKHFVSGGVVYFPGTAIRFSPEELANPTLIGQRGEVVDYHVGYYSTANDIVKFVGVASHYFGGCLKSLWIGLGGKDERFVGWGNEDMQLYGRLSRNKTPLFADNDIVLVHQCHGYTPQYAMRWTESQRKWMEEDNRKGVMVVNTNRDWGVLP